MKFVKSFKIIRWFLTFFDRILVKIFPTTPWSDAGDFSSSLATTASTKSAFSLMANANGGMVLSSDQRATWVADKHGIGTTEAATEKAFTYAVAVRQSLSISSSIKLASD